jgi:hypothetical protein
MVLYTAKQAPRAFSGGEEEIFFFKGRLILPKTP